MNKTKSIVLAGLMCAIHAICTFVFKMEYFVGLEFAVLFLFPFFSAVYSYKAKPVYILSYAIATILVCTIIDPASSLLYIIPTIIVGSVYGFLLKAKLDGMTIVYALTGIEFILFILGSYIIKGITGVDVVETLSNILKFTADSTELGLGFLLLYSFALSAFIYFFTKKSLKKMKIEVTKYEHPNFILLVLSIMALVASLITYEDETYTFFTAICAIVFLLPIVLYGYQGCEKPWIIMLIQGVVFLAASIPLLKHYGEATYKSLVAFILVFLPPYLYGAYHLLFKVYSKE